MQRHNLVSPLRTQKNWPTKKEKLGKSEGKNHSISGSGPLGPCLGVVMGLLLLVLAPETEFRLLVDQGGSGGSDMERPGTNQLCTWGQNLNFDRHRLRFVADLPKLSRGR